MRQRCNTFRFNSLDDALLLRVNLKLLRADEIVRNLLIASRAGMQLGAKSQLCINDGRRESFADG